MHIRVRGIVWSSVACLLLLACEGGHAEKLQECRQVKPGDPATLVLKIYDNYPGGGEKVIKNEPREVLSKYFDNKLTELIISNQDCEKIERGVCDIDFDILFAAQDVDVSNLNFCANADGDVVEARFFNFGNPEVVRYRLTSVTAGWRISDIIYSDDSSLVETLSQ
jgi:hypothetical protein